MAKNYRIVKTALGEEWDAFLASSPDASVFVDSTYLANTSLRLGLYDVFRANERRALVALVESPDGSSAVMDDLVVYSGVMIGAPALNQVHAQVMSERHEITAFIAEQLAEMYQSVDFELSPSIVDIRPFLWYNYGSDADRYRVDVRYTSFVPIADYRSARALEDISIYRSASVARRQQVRYALRDGIVTEESQDVPLFIDFYRKTMVRQNEAVDVEKVERMAQLVDALFGKEKAKMFLSSTADGHVGSVSVFAVDSQRAYYLFGANDPEYRNTPTGTAVLWDAFKVLSAGGIDEVDMEGVNSPRRGWFKLSFGGDLRPYYHVSKQYRQA